MTMGIRGSSGVKGGEMALGTMNGELIQGKSGSIKGYGVRLIGGCPFNYQASPS